MITLWPQWFRVDAIGSGKNHLCFYESQGAAEDSADGWRKAGCDPVTVSRHSGALELCYEIMPETFLGRLQARRLTKKNRGIGWHEVEQG